MVTAVRVPAPVAEGDEPLALLRAAVLALSAEPCEAFEADLLRGEVVELRRQIDLLEAAFVRRVGCLDRLRKVDSDELPASMVAWLRRSCRLSGRAAVERVEVLRQLFQLPLTEEALARGDIGYEHARVIARTAAEVGSEVAQAAEGPLVQSALEVDPSRFEQLAQEACHLLDAAGTADAARRLHARRRLRLHRAGDGGFVLDGLLAPGGGALLTTALNALMMPTRGDTRTTLQRRADALEELARRQLQGGSLPQVAGQRPHATVTISADALRGSDESAATTGVAQLGWAGPVPIETARRLACDAAVSAVTVDAAGTPLDVGRTRRTIPSALRRALVVRDRGCRFPGCDRPPEWTDGHHIRPWAEGGETRLDNLVLLCQSCHTAVHEGGRRLRWGADGELVAEPP